VKLGVELSESTFAPGATVRGGVRVLEGGRARQLTVALRLRERSPGYQHIAREVPGPVLHEGDLEDGQWFDFTLALPPDALPPQQLHHGEVVWEVAAKCDRPGPDVWATARLGETAAEETPPAYAASDGAGVPLLAPDWKRRNG
jgi:hypothetical protein